MTLTFTPAARDALRALIARDPDRPGLRLSFAGGCGAPGYRLATAAAPMPGEDTLDIDGFTVYADYKSRTDLDGARIDVGSEPEELVIVHDHALPCGGSC